MGQVGNVVAETLFSIKVLSCFPMWANYVIRNLSLANITYTCLHIACKCLIGKIMFLICGQNGKHKKLVLPKRFRIGSGTFFLPGQTFVPQQSLYNGIH